MANVFGLIISGRLVDTNAKQVAETQFLFDVPYVTSVNHVVVFLTGQMPLPQDLGAAVYFSFPNLQGQGPSWQLLGHISNSKPSAIFKITNLKQDGGSQSSHPFSQLMQQTQAQIGISVEPLDQLAQQVPVSGAATSTMDTFAEFSHKMLENFFNYASSFSETQAQMTPKPSETYVPLSTLQNWFQTFQRRLQQNPYFWRR